MKNFIYKVTMYTQNPSADGTIIVLTKELANRVIKKYKKLIKKDKKYYGKTTFEIEQLYVYGEGDVLIID